MPRTFRSIISSRLLACFAAAALMLLLSPRAHSAETRVALVVGNGAYQHLTRLPNPPNDAQLIATTLKTLGFKLLGDGAQTDLDKGSLERAIRQFGRELAGGGVGLFYYAGHGLQVQGANYLVPVDANPVSTADVDYELIDAGLALKQMEAAGSKLNLMILDACRNNPFGGRGLRDTGSGLAVMRAPRGTVISYATQPGNVARDGTDGHSPYTRALADAMRKPGNRVLEVFNDVGLEVDKLTRGEQQPWVASSPIEGEFYFAATTPATSAAPPASAAPAAAPPPLPADAELLFWQSVAAAGTAADYEAYLKQYPQGRFVDLAHNRLAATKPASPPDRVPAPEKPTPPVQPAVNRPPRPNPLAEHCAAATGVAGVRQYCVSSVLPALVGDRSGRSTYEPANLFDGNPATAWAKARRQQGSGWILIDFDGEQLVTAVAIANGYQKNPAVFRDNYRVRRLRLRSSSGETATVDVADQTGLQRIALERPMRAEWVQIIIEDLFEGAREPDLAISELRLITGRAP
jgi:uncharacterized caspase-like protein